MKRKELMRWLKDHGFTEQPSKATGHLHFTHPSGVKVTVRGHGKADMSTSHLSLLARDLGQRGLFDAAALRREWGLR